MGDEAADKYNSKAKPLLPQHGYMEERFVAGLQGVTALKSLHLHADVLLLALYINLYFRN